MLGDDVTTPRIQPGNRRDLGLVNYQLARIASRAVGARHRLNLFTTLGRHRTLFRAWARFAGELIRHGALSRSDSELVILRVAHNCDCEYEWQHHERMAAEAGLPPASIVAVKGKPPAGVYSRHQEALLRAVDELHGERELSDATWSELRQTFSEEQMIELCMLVGNYEMAAMTAKSLRVEPDPV